MTRFLKGTDRPLAEAYQLALLDLDGVAYRGKNPVDTRPIPFVRPKPPA